MRSGMAREEEKAKNGRLEGLPDGLGYHPFWVSFSKEQQLAFFSIFGDL